MISIDNIVKTFYPLNSRVFDYIGCMYMNIFNETGLSYRIYYNKNKKLVLEKSYDKFNVREDLGAEINDRYFITEALKYQNDANKDIFKVFAYSNFEYMIIYDDGETKFLINETLSDMETSSSHCLHFMTNNDKKTLKIIKSWIKPTKVQDDVEFGITAVDVTGSLYTSWYNYAKKHDVDIKLNYNDDIPYEKICKLLEGKDEPELLLFYGEPGTGKSSLIKHLISKYKDNDFVFIDGSLLANIGHEKLMSYFLENQNTIFILEDCEKVLMDREQSINPVMPILLNITDGIIGDVLGIKLICTFNTSLNKIDKALTRKGRLSLKYEFKKLAAEKVRKILKDDTIKEDMALSDIYNYAEENDFSKKQTKRIGFT